MSLIRYRIAHLSYPLLDIKPIITITAARPFNTRHLDLSGVKAIDGRGVKIHNGGHAHVNVQNKPTFNKIWLGRMRAAAKMDVGMWKHIFQHSNSIFLT